jgi:anti-sigma factor RsiW
MSAEPLNCRQVVELVTEYLDGGLRVDERLAFEQHVAVCPPCRGYLSQLRLIARTAGTLREEDVPEPLRESLLEAFRDWTAGPRKS